MNSQKWPHWEKQTMWCSKEEIFHLSVCIMDGIWQAISFTQFTSYFIWLRISKNTANIAWNGCIFLQSLTEKLTNGSSHHMQHVLLASFEAFTLTVCPYVPQIRGILIFLAAFSAIYIYIYLIIILFTMHLYPR